MPACAWTQQRAAQLQVSGKFDQEFACVHRSVGGTPWDNSTPRAIRMQGDGGALQPLSAASARLITSVLLFLSFMLAMIQRNFGGAGLPAGSG